MKIVHHSIHILRDANLKPPSMRQTSKKRLLVFTSTFPRWHNDPKPSFVFELCRRLSREFDVYVLAPQYPGAMKEENWEGIKIRRYAYFIKKYQKMTGLGGILSALTDNKWFYFQIPFLFFWGWIALIQQVSKIKPHIIHAHWILPQGFIAYLTYQISKTPYIVTSHGSDIFGLSGFHGLKRLCLRRARNITVVSDALKERIKKDIDPSLNPEVIPMGVDTAIFMPCEKNPVIIRKYNIQGPMLLFVGRLAREKGIDYLIRAFERVVRHLPKAKLLIVGGGDQRDRLGKLSRNLRLQNNVHFAGIIPNRELPRFYATADVFVCPSLREGSPVSYIESLACGTPIIAGDLPVSREIVGSNNKRGAIVNQMDPVDISEKILSILNRQEIPVNELYDFVRVNYDWNIIAGKLSKLLAA